VYLCLSYAYALLEWVYNVCCISLAYIVNVKHFSRSTVYMYTKLGLILEAKHCDAEDESKVSTVARS